jgi:tRNA(Ile2)-agmatinylcytidine synthase
VLRFEIGSDQLENLYNLIMKNVWDYVEGEYPNTNPGIVLVEGNIPEPVVKLSERAMWRALPISLGVRTVENHRIKHIAFGNARGLIGALASVGNRLEGDHTFEYLAYRSIDEGDVKRGVDPDSVFEMDEQWGDHLFSNIDRDSRRILIEPHGPDPVLFGVRGENPDVLIKAVKMVRTKQPIERWMIFRTNQGTGEHLAHEMMVNELRPYMATEIEGVVNSKPKMLEGGHVLFTLNDETGIIDCMAYEPTGKFRDAVQLLRVGDRIVIGGGVRPASSTHGLTLNIEKLTVVRLIDEELRNPLCSECNARMKSAGKGKGFKCAKCGFKDSNAEKVAEKITRKLNQTYYLPAYSAQRHLTRPRERLGKKNEGVPSFIENDWHNP